MGFYCAGFYAPPGPRRDCTSFATRTSQDRPDRVGVPYLLKGGAFFEGRRGAFFEGAGFFWGEGCHLVKRGRGLPPELKEVGEGGFKRGGFFFELGGV